METWCYKDLLVSKIDLFFSEKFNGIYLTEYS